MRTHTILLRRLCELQFLALVFALPFEYYFAGRENSLLSSLKLQLLLLSVTWALVKTGDLLKREVGAAAELRRLLPERLLLAVVAFVFVQALAAAFARTPNAEAAAAKWAAGAFLALMAADLFSGWRSRASREENAPLHPLSALSISGFCAAILGLGQLAGSGLCTRVAHVFQSSEYFLGDRLRLASTMEYPNTAGSILSATLCASIALAAFSGRGRKAQKWIWMALAAVQGAALALTYSRGAVLSTIFAVGVAIWTSRKIIQVDHGRIALAAGLAVVSAGAASLYFIRHEVEREGPARPRRVARYGLEAGEEMNSFLPGREYEKTIAIRNDSPESWLAGVYGVACRWYSLADKGAPPLQTAAEFKEDIAPSEEVRLKATLRSPPSEGEYLLIWYIFSRNGKTQELKDSYSPATLCLVSCQGPGKQSDLSGKARSYLDAVREERRSLNSQIRPGRLQLWHAAFRMFRERPLLGMGPDSFRLLKWKYMDIPSGDDTILANSLYLEFLSGSGLLGLLSFFWLMWELGRGIKSKMSLLASPPDWLAGCFGSAYLAGLALHGVVDYFLKFTPTFLLFWLMVGILCSREPARDRERPESRT